jgi:hypothetical protein
MRKIYAVLADRAVLVKHSTTALPNLDISAAPVGIPAGNEC